MSSTVASAKQSSATLWTGRVMSGIVVLFLLMDAGMKLADMEPKPVLSGRPPCSIR